MVAYPMIQMLVEPTAAQADVETAVKQYVDPQDSFQLAVPSGWLEEETQLDGNSSFTGSSGARRTLIWYSPDMPASEVNVTLTITNTSAEFTRLGSFGNVFTFGQNLVNSMDQRFLLRVRGNKGSEPVQIARLEDALETKGMYFVDYTIEKLPGPKRHLYSLVALAFNGRYNRLYTLTAQCLEEQVPQVAPVLKQVLASFVPPAGVA
eukprot:gene6301-6536_t